MAGLHLEGEGCVSGEHSQLQQWLSELSREQQKAVEVQLACHHDALLRILDERFLQLEKQLMGPTVIDSDDNAASRTQTDKVDQCQKPDHSDGQGTQIERSASKNTLRTVTPMSPFQGNFVKQLTKEVDSSPPETWFQWCRHSWTAWRGAFDLLMGIVVMFNVALLFAHLQEPGTNHEYMVVCDHVLNITYLVEIALRITFEHRDFITVMNIVDSMIVALTCLDAYVFHNLQDTAGILRLLKILRIGKTLRVIRTMSQFRHLRVLLSTIASSFMSLFWSMIILGLCQLTFGLLLCQLLQPWVADPSNDPETRSWVNKMYGTSSKAVYSVFEVTFSGGWPNYVRPLIDHLSPAYAVLFMIYVTGVNFSIIKIISALFLKETLHTAESNPDMRIHQMQAERREFLGTLHDLFDEADLDGNSSITFDEFEKLVSYPRVRAWFSSIEVDMRDSRTIFGLLDSDGDGQIGFEEFATGILSLKGLARSQDIARFLRSADKLLALTQDTRLICQSLAARHDTPSSRRTLISL